MVHQDHEDHSIPPQIKQVEFNTIASSFGGLSGQTSKLHRFVAFIVALTGANVVLSYLSQTSHNDLLATSPDRSPDLPENRSAKGLAAGLQAAHKAYVDQGTTNPPCVIFIVQDAERNIFDQRHLEYALQSSSPPVTAFRLPVSQILLRTTIAATKKRELLYVHPSSPNKTYEVSVVYYRSMYGPSDYPDPTSWEARLHIERSHAIKCPTILTQLAGCKKVQQVLATPGQNLLSTFLTNHNTSQLSALENTFTNIYPMDTSSAGKEAQALALDAQKCLGYVLKPQREGGGNNTYRSAIPPFLQSQPPSHWKSYILMEIISPPTNHQSDPTQWQRRTGRSNLRTRCLRHRALGPRYWKDTVERRGRISS